MTATAEEIAAARRYMHVDLTGDDTEDAAENALIGALIAAAKTYLSGAGVTEPEETDDLYNLAVWSLTLHYYDNRNDVGSESPLPVGLRPILTQLKLANGNI